MQNLKSLVTQARDCVYVLKWGVQSRLLILLLQLIFHNVIPDHTHSMNDVFMKGHRIPPHDVITEKLLGGFDNWDSEYYIFIAEKGYYRYEQTMAFFPLYPFLMRFMASTVFYPLTLLTSFRSVLLTSGVVINFTVFPIAVASLYFLTLELTQNRRLSFLAAILFCLNPAGVFMSTVYTESLFAFFSFTGMLFIQKKYTWIGALCFSCATATRSNGIVLTGFIGYSCLVTMLAHSKLGTAGLNRATANAVSKTVFATGLQCLVVLAPFVLFQGYGYLLYCTESWRDELNSFENVTLEPPSWCNWQIPVPYSYIQDHYWHVGFLRYFELKQTPNFLLAAPTVLVCVLCVWRYFSPRASQVDKDHTHIITGIRLRPYIIHLLFLLTFGVFNIHIQVLTRFIFSSSPVVYWFTAEAVLVVFAQLKISRLLDPKLYSGYVIVLSVARALFKMDVSSVSRSVLIWSRLAVCYFAGYIVVGCALHCNFYPWT